MDTAITFRPVRDEDRDFLCQLYASTRQEEMALVDWSETEKQAFLTMQFEAQHRYYMEHFAQAEFSIIERGGVAIGRLYLDRRIDEHRLIDIALLPDYRGQGLGSFLLRQILDEARTVGKPVGIHVERNNPALRLYQRLGFQHVDDYGVYFLMRWSPDSVASATNTIPRRS